MQEILSALAARQILTQKQAREAFTIMMEGNASEAEITAFLMALHIRGEDKVEITEGARILREKAKKITAPTGAIDIVGTGGDCKHSLNISTGTALIVAGCSVPVAKHGNSAISSKSGAADVLKALGVDIDAPFDAIECAMREACIGFLMAPRHHSAMRHVSAARKTLKIPTIFNLLGPLANPAGVKRYFIGVYHKRYMMVIVQALKALGAEKAWVVHSADGHDELSPSCENYVAELKDGVITETTINADDAGIPPCTEEELRGGDSTYNARAIIDMLEGKPSGYLNACLFNASASLLATGEEDSLEGAYSRAKKAVTEGHAKAALQKLIDITAR
jgi:anthranilate phosphoribosyltransferase